MAAASAIADPEIPAMPRQAEPEDRVAEERDGEQRECVDAVENLVRKQNEIGLVVEKIGQDEIAETGEADRPGDLHAQHDEDHEQDDQGREQHGVQPIPAPAWEPSSLSAPLRHAVTARARRSA